MVRRISEEKEKKILELVACGTKKDNIGRMVGVGRETVFAVLRRNRVPEKKPSALKQLTDLVSIRLLYVCDDYELLSKRLAVEVLYQKPETIYVSSRIQKVLKKEKIEKIVSIVERVGVRCNIEYTQKIAFG